MRSSHKDRKYAFNQIIRIASESCLQEQQQLGLRGESSHKQSHLKHTNFGSLHVARSQIFVFKADL